MPDREVPDGESLLDQVHQSMVSLKHGFDDLSNDLTGGVTTN